MRIRTMGRAFEYGPDDAVSVGTSFTTVGLQTGLDHGKNSVAVEVENIDDGNTQSLSDFKMQLRDHPSGEWYDWISGASWTNGAISEIEFCTTQGPQDLPHTTLAHAHIRIPAVEGVRFQAKVAANTTNVKTKFSIDAV